MESFGASVGESTSDMAMNPARVASWANKLDPPEDKQRTNFSYVPYASLVTGPRQPGDVGHPSMHAKDPNIKPTPGTSFLNVLPRTKCDR